MPRKSYFKLNRTSYIGPFVLKTKCSMKHSAQLISATVMCIFGCALLVAGMVTPPAGEIDASVLIAFGEILTFAGSLFGIDYKYKSKTKDRGAERKKTAGAQRQKTKD